MNITNIYGLVDPRTEIIRCIGKANDVDRRLRRHLKLARDGRTDHKSRWIASLLVAGLSPRVVVIETCAVEEWKQRECLWIARYRETNDLTNAKNGGDGTEPDEATRAKMSAARRGRSPHNKGMATPGDVRERQRIAARLRWERMTPEDRIEWGKQYRGRVGGNAARSGWSHTPESRAKIGAANARSRTITGAQAATVKRLLAQGMKAAVIAREVGIRPHVVYGIKYGQAYRDV